MVLSTSLSGLSIQPTSTMKKSGKVSLVSANVACCSATFILVHDTHTPTHTTHIHTGVREVERVSENQTLPPQERDTHRPGLIVCTCKPEDSSTLYQNMQNYQASFHLISPHEFHSDDSNWESLGVTFVFSALINSIVQSL